MSRPNQSLEPEYFERIYADSLDPWGFETRAYEREKYAATLAALPRARYERALEIGCAIGVLTALLAERCAELLAVDVNVAVLNVARQRTAHQPNVELEQMMFPREVPDGTFDLIVVSEVAYYWGGEEFELAKDLLLDLLVPGGTLVLVHYTPEDTDYPKTGHEVHDEFMSLCAGPAPRLLHVSHREHARYRLDVFERR